MNSSQSVETLNNDPFLTDETLVILARDGVDSAYVELCRRYKKMAFLTINRIMRHKEDSEDALQDTLLKVYLHLDTFDGRSKFSTWLTRIAINSALMAIRKKTLRPTQSLDELTENNSYRLRSLSCASLSPEAQYAQHEMSFRLRQAVNRLPPLLRNVTALRQSSDMSVAEVAASTGISVAAAKSRLLRARTELSSILSTTIGP